ncbi:MAG: hypothetical protein EOP53_10835 [Sphingobacteriales bacterium]|nr:MAG: hypothetical protein EOP53_10835 [Sphingobacteriales bacterium]
MKALNLKAMFAMVFFAAVTMVSCKKNKEEILIPAEPVAKIEGQWIGKYGNKLNPPSNFYAFNILPNGVLQVLDDQKAVTGMGTWVLEDGQTFKAVYKYNNGIVKYNLAAKYDAAAKKINGSWGAGEEVADDGEFFLAK